MYCKSCGKYNPDGKERCVYCGGELGKTATKIAVKQVYENKTLVGFLLGLFLPVLGFLIGIFLYVTDDYEFRTFMRGWALSMIVSIVLVPIIVFAATGCALSNLFY